MLNAKENQSIQSVVDKVNKLCKNKRDPERIEKILTSIQHLWEKQPDLRLGQLLIWVMSHRKSITCPDMFYFEDDDLLSCIEITTKRNNNV